MGSCPGTTTREISSNPGTTLSEGFDVSAYRNR